MIYHESPKKIKTKKKNPEEEKKATSYFTGTQIRNSTWLTSFSRIPTDHLDEKQMEKHQN